MGDIYIPAASNQTALAQNASSILSLGLFLTSAPTCLNEFTRFVCLNSFRVCDASGEARVLCPSICSALTTNCAGTVAEPYLPNCDTFTDASGSLVFQEGTMIN